MKYLGYAIGELVLIIAGILLAIEISQSIEERERRAEQIVLTKQLLAAVQREQRGFQQFVLRTLDDTIQTVNRLERDRLDGAVSEGLNYARLVYTITPTSLVKAEFESLVGRLDSIETAGLLGGYFIDHTIAETFYTTRTLPLSSEIEESIAPYIDKQFPEHTDQVHGWVENEEFLIEYANNKDLRDLVYLLYLNTRTARGHIAYMLEQLAEFEMHLKEEIDSLEAA